MADEESMILVALIASLVAIIIALGQLLAQIFGTVEGYRRCQPSVLGPFWARKTKARWRWSQFRIEIFFTTPEIALVSSPPAVSPSSFLTIAHSISSPEAARETSDAPVNKLRSWDFMPPDVVRPFASTTLSDIAILARRMGMTWTEFKPAEGVLEAQGSGHALSSTTVRGVGLMLTYRLLSESGLSNHKAISNLARRDRLVYSSDYSIPKALVCTTHTDMMWFGLLPGNVELGLPNLEIGTSDKIYATLSALDPSGKAARNLRALQAEDARRLHGFCDIVPMVAPWLRQRPGTLNQYPRPWSYTYGLTWYHVAYHAFYHRLCEYHKHGFGTLSTRWVETEYLALQNMCGDEWDRISPNVNFRKGEFFDKIQRLYEQTTRYFLNKKQMTSEAHQRHNGIDYMDLVTAHLCEAPRSYGDA
ncbi:hypothetical protein TruAng_003327 [Truncatella angustata]|nr:hypothetical protein TruAng_003327 [Truncatella angustata]